MEGHIENWDTLDWRRRRKRWSSVYTAAITVVIFLGTGNTESPSTFLVRHAHGFVCQSQRRFRRGIAVEKFDTKKKQLKNRWVLEASSAASDDLPAGVQSTVNPNAEGTITIRRGKFSDLPMVATLILDCFYEAKPNYLRYHYLRELDRLQSNFPYDNRLHDYFVAEISGATETPIKEGSPKFLQRGNVVGFVDIDCRTRNNVKIDTPPTPYLSDLAVGEHVRRQGIASRLVRQCEDFVGRLQMETINLRVRDTNEVAIAMYLNKLGYTAVKDHPFFGVKDDTVLLTKTSLQPFPMDGELAEDAEAAVVVPAGHEEERKKNDTVHEASTRNP